MSSELSHEQERLLKVIETISEQINHLEDDTGKLRKEVVNIRKHFWDDVKVNIDTFDDYLETIIGLRQQAQALSVSQSTHRHSFNKLSALRRMHASPYFGRIDFKEEGESITEKIYIGISTLTDKSGENFLVYDWRAPISSVYYDYPPGPADYSTPGGEISGELEEKWQYIIRDGVIESMFDTTVTIGDEILQQVLGKGTDKHMHSIVASIQQEQNKIIRHDRGRLLIVQGAAGSGKTSAALQRIAYLLYKYREWIKADQIILFSPNAMFNHYVSRVLPELGEENMEQVTFQEYLDHRLSKSFQVENPYQQLEYVLTGMNTPSYKTRIGSIKYKASIDFYEVVQTYRKSLEDNGMLFKGLKFRGKPIVTSKQLEEKFYQYDSSYSFHSRIEKLTDWLNTLLDETEKLELKKSWVEEEIQLLSKDEYQKVYKILQEKEVFTENSFEDYEKESKMLGKMIVRKKLKPHRKWVKSLSFIDVTGIYKQLFSTSDTFRNWNIGNKPKAWNEICLLTTNMINEGNLLYEDATPFLLLKELILGFQTNTSIKHILIDEAQDYSPFQFEFLKRLFPAAKMTVLGDFNQAIFMHASDMVDFHTLTRLYGQEETDIIQLTQSYRSTKQITEFTRALLPDGNRIIAFDRGGEKPELTKLSNYDDLHSDITSKVNELMGRSYNTIAIICKSASESLNAYEALSHIEDIKLVKSGSIEYEQGIVVIPSYLAKGIEFDAVIIYNASAETYGDESLRRLFYTACTRAMHYLKLYSVGEPSPFLQNLGTDCLSVTLR
ncbi:RNA polymerase recycling motor HelD [Bacillus marasmi]|uniref:RNA polymerase recycling motor HelD n=1 Tax=Bacillus marasmi TaxID=1926279 RepID=UPI0011C7EB97|nr:RNA polymerase recycling motor HelD [Bacillus marasmi]